MNESTLIAIGSTLSGILFAGGGFYYIVRHQLIKLEQRDAELTLEISNLKKDIKDHETKESQIEAAHSKQALESQISLSKQLQEIHIQIAEMRVEIKSLMSSRNN